MPAHCPALAAPSPATRSRVTNHADLLPGLDGRSASARRFRDLIGAFIADAGGLDRCSEVKLGLLRRLAAASVLAEVIEARAVNGEPVDVNEFCTLASTTVRLSQRVGISRVPRDVTPTVNDYIDNANQESTAA
jgi:hypothetical protein